MRQGGLLERVEARMDPGIVNRELNRLKARTMDAEQIESSMGSEGQLVEALELLERVREKGTDTANRLQETINKLSDL